MAALGYRLATNFPPRGNNAPAASARLWWGLAPAWRRQREGGAAGLATGAGKPAGRLPLPGRSGHLAGGGRLGNARGRVLHLEPVRGAPGAVGRVPVLRHNAFILQTCRNTTPPGWLRCSFKRSRAWPCGSRAACAADRRRRARAGQRRTETYAGLALAPEPFTIKLALSRRKQGFESPREHQ